MAPLTLDARRALLPAAGVPLLYFAFAHVCLAAAFGALVLRPAIAAGFYYHPRMVALVHLVTLGWISGSILGAFYIVGPLVLRMPLRPGWLDRLAFAAFATGVAGMTAGFWTGNYTAMSWSSGPVLAAILHVAVRGWRGLAGARVPRAIKAHVALAFANIVAAGSLGTVIGFDRMAGSLPWSPLSAAFAHAHLAAIGWAVMMVVGIGYRLVPMVLPAAMPEGRSLLASAILLQTGVVLLAIAIIRGSGLWTLAALFLLVAGLASFLAHLIAMFERRLPPPAALPKPDWATRQTRVAFAFLLVAIVTGVALVLPGAEGWGVPLGWTYGVAGLIGFLSQIVVGIQGRLLPLHGWYGVFEARGLQQPPLSAHEAGSLPFARAIFVAWCAGVPLLAVGLALADVDVIRAGSMLLLIGVGLNAAHAVVIVARLRSS
jgi:hypothetical protein